MFQNIVNEIEEENQQEINNKGSKKNNKIKTIIKNALTKQNILMYIISFMLSMVSCGNENIAPFGLAMFAAICSNGIPMGIIYLLMIIGTFIGFGTQTTLTFILTTLAFVTMIIIFKPEYQEQNVNEKRKLGKYIFISTLIVQVASMLFSGFLVYDLLASILMSVTVYIFYKIFTNSIILINELDIKTAFSIEEVIGASLMLSIAISAFGDFSIFGLQIKNILNILIVLILGWKNGMLIGATSGVTIGAVLGIIGTGSPEMIASYALSGLIAGIFSKLGKVGVIVGFIIGNTLLAYATNGNTAPIIYLKEILVASLGLLLVPKNIEINIEEFFVKDKFLPVTGDYRLEENKDTVEKLNTVSETIQEISTVYTKDDKKNKEIFIEELNKNLIGMEENILFDDIQNPNEEIIDDIFNELNQNERIESEKLIDIFEKHNNYIVGFEDEETNKRIEKDIKNIVRTINNSYKTSKINFICTQKINENKKTLSHQLSGVSKVIDSLAQDIDKTSQEEFKEQKEKIKVMLKQKGIELVDLTIKQEQNKRYIINLYTEACKKENKKQCPIKAIEKILSKVLEEEIVIQKEKCAMKLEQNICKQIYVSKDKYSLQIGIAKAKKENSSVSGDTSIQTKLDDGKYLVAISDGMGSGPEARKSSKIAIKMLERLLTNGFDKDSSLELINSTIALNTEEDMYSTLDVAIFDLYLGNVEFIKNGACPTYIKNGKEVQLMKSISLPAGILEDIDLVVHDKDLEENDIFVMCSDGIIESNTEYQNKELWVKNILEDLITDNVQKIADIILQESIDNGYGIAKDDMTIIVIKIKKL